MSNTNILPYVLLVALLSMTMLQPSLAQPPIYHRTIDIEGVKVFYREAGPTDAPNVLLLHGFPTSSKWQSYFREHQPPTLIVWGKNDQIFPAEGAHPYLRDLQNVEFHLLDTGHFALEEDGELIADRMLEFLNEHAGE